ncbi:sigma factor accessory [Bacillus phage SP-10]|uniref:sigma factor accessory n=1 Tax=Bacillus phage SP10 TaxID=941058 RepID=UPI0002198B9B|nr:sigma factor accessory [Bacillus phage SP-10]BAK53011.1 sigma factor accessory [Bacillus phage SP-10]
MGTLKEILEHSIKNKARVRGRSHMEQLFMEYQEKYSKLIGQPAIWKTSNNTNIKVPQLVVVEEAGERFVLLKKATFNLEGVEGLIRYAVSYTSIYSGHDSVNVWSDDID